MTVLDDASGGLKHVGVLYDDVDDLVAGVLPSLDQALLRGDAVSTVVDRRTARGLRVALGDRAGALTFASPHTGLPRAEGFVARMRDTVTATPGRRAWVLAQYSAFATSDEELRVGEAGVNLVLADLPFTMVCACARDAGPGPADTVRHAHPSWLEGTHTADNPGFSPPDDRSATPSDVWGGVHVVRLHFGATVDLHRVRAHTAALAAEVGLRGERAQAAVLAVHEAAVVACDEVADARRAASGTVAPVVPAIGSPGAVRGRPGTDDPCVLDLWTAGRRLVAEIHGPRPPDAPEAVEAPHSPEARLPRNRLRVAGPLRLVRTFCADVTSRETPEARTVRIVAGP